MNCSVCSNIERSMRMWYFNLLDIRMTLVTQESIVVILEAARDLQPMVDLVEVHSLFYEINTNGGI